MSTNAQQARIPSGNGQASGQFAATGHAEPNATLDTAPQAVPNDGTHTRPWVEFRRAADSDWRTLEFDSTAEAIKWSYGALGSDVADVSEVHTPEDWEIPDPESLRDDFGDDAEAVAEALGDGPPLTDNQRRLLAAVVNEDSYYIDDVADTVNEIGNDIYDGRLSLDDSERIAGALRDHYFSTPTGYVLPDGEAANFSFELEHDGDGATTGYETSVYLGHESGMYVAQWHDIQDLGCTNQTGLRAALETAEQIDADWRETANRAVKLGLISGPPPRLDMPPDTHTA